MCAILLYLSIVVVVVQFGFFYTYLYCRHLWNFNSHFVVVSLSVAFTLPLSHAALSHCRRSLGQSSLFFSLSHFTQIRHALVHVHLLLFIACERVLLICHSLNATTGALSLSPALIHFECVRSHFELFRHLRQIDFKVGGTFRI